MRDQGGSTVTPEEVAKRFRTRTGYRLANYAEVGIPVYVLSVRVLTLIHKQLPPIEEFVLKALDASLTNTADISAFLGVEPKVVEGGLAGLALSEAISLVGAEGSRFQLLQLTNKGKKILETAEVIEPEERSIQIYYDGIIRRVAWYGSFDLLRYRDLADEGLLEIPAIPQRRPQLQDLKVQEVERLLRANGDASDYKKDLLAIKAIDRFERRFLRGVALLYKAEEGRGVQVGFAVDGKLSNEHENAFARAEGPKKLRLEEQLYEPIQELAELRTLRDSITPDRFASLDQEALQRASELAEASLAKAESQLAAAKSTEVAEVAKRDIESAKETITRTRTELDRIGVRFVYVHEHPTILRDALENASDRLMINSPWITRAVVNRDFLRRLENLLKKKVRVYIGWGLGAEESKNDPVALKSLVDLMRKYDNFWFTRLGDTHAKVLLVDRKYAVVTSFNWLSFRGDPNLEFRDEQGTKVQIPELIDQKFDWLLARFEAAGRQV
jgi:hypothetical protein